MHACVNVRFPLTAGLAAQTRVTTHTHHAWGQDGHPHICPHHWNSGSTMQGADACQGGHNGRMWCIVLTHGAMGRGLPTANVLGWYMWRVRWLMLVKAEPVHVEIDPNCELELFTVVHIVGCYQWHNKVMKGRRKGYENDLYWEGAANICVTKMPIFFSKTVTVYKLEC